MGIQKISYSNHEEWLSIRNKYIGGSDAGAVVGLDDYKSPYSLWAEKTGRIPSFSGNITTSVGAYLEEFVAKMFSEQTGKKVRKCNFTLAFGVFAILFKVSINLVHKGITHSFFWGTSVL